MSQPGTASKGSSASGSKGAGGAPDDGASSAGAGGAGAPRTIDLDTLSLEELNQLRQQEESRLQALTNKYGMLRQAAARLNQSVKAVSELKPHTDGKEVMVPLTESVYVPGKIREPNRLLVELGTGYFVEKSNKDTVGFLERKQKLVDLNSENITQAIQASRQNVDALNSAMNGKLLEIRARQEGARHRQSVESG